MSRVSDADIEAALDAWNVATMGDGSYSDAIRAALEAVSSIHEAEPVDEPQAWRVKDYADGWWLVHTHEEAVRFADNGNLIQPLYAHPAPISKGVTVKALEWEVYGAEDAWEFSSYPNPYFIGKQSGDGRYWVHHRIMGDLRGNDGRIVLHGTEPEAKAAAQADFDARIRSCLSHTAGEAEGQ